MLGCCAGVLEPPKATATAATSGRGPMQAAWQASMEGLFRAWPALRALLLAGAVERLAAWPRSQGLRNPETLSQDLSAYPGACCLALLRLWAERLLTPPGASGKPKRGAKRKTPDGQSAGQRAAPAGGAAPWVPAPAQAAVLLRSCLLALGAAAPCAWSRASDPAPGPGAAPSCGITADPMQTPGRGAAEPSGRVDAAAQSGAAQGAASSVGAATAGSGAALGSGERELSTGPERLAALRWLAAALAPHVQAHARRGGSADLSGGAPPNPGRGLTGPALAACAQALARLAVPSAAHGGSADADAAAEAAPVAIAGPDALERARGAQAALLRRPEPADSTAEQRCAPGSAGVPYSCMRSCMQDCTPFACMTAGGAAWGLMSGLFQNSLHKRSLQPVCDLHVLLSPHGLAVHGFMHQLAPGTQAAMPGAGAGPAALRAWAGCPACTTLTMRSHWFSYSRNHKMIAALREFRRAC